MLQQLVVIASITGCLAAAVPLNTPAVAIRNGTVVGNSTNGIDNFWGIPYAKAPIADLRLRPPQTIEQKFGHLTLPGTLDQVTACPQMTLSSFNLTTNTKIPKDQQANFYGLTGNFEGLQGEDCLTINVQRPSNFPPQKKLPVLAWIYGGGYEIGTTQSYDGTPIIQQSVEMGEPVIFVDFNYRLNAFGFLQGKELAAEGATNLGLRDQRKALEWIAENIDAFGGDPDRVTIGESAGSISVYDHLTINNGDNNHNGKPLFHGGIMNSGTILYTQSATSTKAQAVFDEFVGYAGCPSDSSNNGSQILECLRQMPYTDFKTAMNRLPNFGQPNSNNLAYVRRADQSDDFYSQFGEVAAKTGQYAHVPIIMGNVEDEATVFTPAQIGLINNTQTMVDYFAGWLTETPRKLVKGLIDTYPANPAAGLPMGTGSKNEIYPMSKRNAAIQTDLTFTAGRRVALSYMSSQIPTWSYLATYLHDNPWWGTFHTADLATLFGGDDFTFTRTKWLEAYIHFVNCQDPNGRADQSKAWWPKWDNEGLQLANFSASEVGVTTDDFRWKSYEYWRRHGSQMRI